MLQIQNSQLLETSNTPPWKVVSPLAMLYSVTARFNFRMDLNAWACKRDTKKCWILNLLGNFEKAEQALVLKQAVNHKVKIKTQSHNHNNTKNK